MGTTPEQLEKNVSASFAYVKKDILMLNDSYTKIQEAIQQIAKSYTVLGNEVKQLKKELDKKPSQKAVKKTINSKNNKLSIIEGIGPVIEKILKKNKITTFKQLSNKKSSEIKKILDKEGPRFQMHDPTTWPKQAKLANESKWSELEKLQDELKGGVKVSTKKTKNPSKKAIKKVIKTETVYN